MPAKKRSEIRLPPDLDAEARTFLDRWESVTGNPMTLTQLVTDGLVRELKRRHGQLAAYEAAWKPPDEPDNTEKGGKPTRR